MIVLSRINSFLIYIYIFLRRLAFMDFVNSGRIHENFLTQNISKSLICKDKD